jgi:hypothetical protein
MNIETVNTNTASDGNNQPTLERVSDLLAGPSPDTANHNLKDAQDLILAFWSRKRNKLKLTPAQRDELDGWVKIILANPPTSPLFEQAHAKACLKPFGRLAAPQESPGASETTQSSPSGDKMQISSQFLDHNRPVRTNNNQTL